MNTKSKIKRFAAYYKPHMRMFMLDMLCAVGVAAVDVLYPLFSNLALKSYLPQGRYEAFFLVVILAVLAHILRAGMEYIITNLGHMVGVRMEADMRRDIFSHLQTLSFNFFNKARVGTLMSNCTHDLFEVTELAHHGPEDLLVSVLTFFGAIAVMCSIEWRLALVLLISMPLMCTVIILLRKRMLMTSRHVKEGLAVVNASIESSLSGMRVSQAFCNEHYEVEKFCKGNEIYVHARGGYYRTMAQFFTAMEFFTSILKVVVLGVGGLMIIQGRMDIVALMTFSLYVASFTSPIRKLTNFAEVYVSGMAGFNRFCEVLDTPPDIADAPGAIDLGKAKGSIVFQDVNFSYIDGEEDMRVLHDANISIAAGATVALVGSSGSGKTTLCHLVPRFYDPEKGAVLVDGHDVRSLTLASLRKNVGIVQQDVFLFADSIHENIRYGCLTATEEEIIEAAKAAEIHEEIMAMPEGYDTIVGERGVTLSGGQKQRISIARIFLKNPPILILDEATSALDSITEARINASLARLRAGRTSLVIAHRLSTVRGADEILVIEEGYIRERGTHEELLAMGGEYAHLYQAQQMVPLVDNVPHA